MTGASCAIRGTFFDFVHDPWKNIGHEQDSARFIRDGLLVVKDGIIEDFGTFADVSPRHPGLSVTHIQNRLILPEPQLNNRLRKLYQEEFLLAQHLLVAEK